MIIGHTGWVPKAERTKSKGPPTRSRGPEDASRLSIFSFFKFAEECEMVELGKLLQLRESVAVKEWKRRLRHFFRAPIISHFLFILARIHPPQSRGVLRGRHVLQIQPAHDFGEETLGGQLDNMICIWSFRIWRTRGGRYNIGVIWSKFNQSGEN